MPFPLSLRAAMLAAGVESGYLSPRMKTVTQVLCAVLLAFAAGCGERGSPPAEPAGPRAQTAAPDGFVVYQRGPDLYSLEIGGTEKILAKNASWPRVSPDGRWVACVSGREIRRIGMESGAVETLTTADAPRAVCWSADGAAVFFTDGRTVRRCEVRTGASVTVLDGREVMELDVAPGERLLAATVKRFGYAVWVFTLPGGHGTKLAAGCSASLSPDGMLATVNVDGHRELALMDPSGATERGRIRAPAGMRLDNQFWSNDQGWLAVVSEGDARDVYLQRSDNGAVFRVTQSGDCDRPDLWVRQSAPAGAQAGGGE